jgi:hypothetical protein
MQLNNYALASIGLEPKERSVLALLVRRRHLSPEQIMIHLYADRPDCEQPEPESETIRKTIERICRKVSAHIADFELSKTDCGWQISRDAIEKLKLTCENAALSTPPPRRGGRQAKACYHRE